MADVEHESDLAYADARADFTEPDRSPSYHRYGSDRLNRSDSELDWAEFEVGWKASRERRRVFLLAASATAIVIAIALAVFFFFPPWLRTHWQLFQDRPITWDATTRDNFNGIVSGATLTLTLGIGLATAAYREHQRRIFRMTVDIEVARRKMGEAMRVATGSAGPHVTQLWDVTEKRLDYYHQIAISQAASSFRMAQAAMAAGFIVVVSMAVVAALSRSGTTSIVAGALGATGGGLAAYIGTTFVRSQEAASTSLRSYFLQPTEFYRYLAAERLISTLEPADRAEAVSAIARAIVLGRDDVRATDS